MLFKREVGKSPASFLFIRAIPWVLTKCATHDQAELLVRWTGLDKTAGQIRVLKAEDLDTDDIEMYLNKVKRHNKKVDAAQDELEAWPKEALC